MKIALYKCAFDGNALDEAINLFSGRGGYSHAELVFSDGVSFSSTSRDRSVDCKGREKPDGTRFKEIDYTANPNRWSLFDIPIGPAVECGIRSIAKSLLDARYDYWGCVRFVIPFVKEHRQKYFCSEVVVELLRHAGQFTYLVPHKTSPNALAKVLRRLPKLPSEG